LDYNGAPYLEDSRMCKRQTAFGVLLAIMLGGAAVPTASAAAYDDAITAYERGDYDAALKLLLPEANAGNANAQYAVGVVYANGNGVAKDPVEAVKWYRKAAEQGLASAQYNLADCYLSGTGVAKDPPIAAKWFRLAADQGDPWAQYNLGRMYGDGTGVPQDWAEAVKWHRKSAEQSDEFAMNSLGARYQAGTGVVKDLVTAQMWFILSAEKKNSVAEENRVKLDALLSPDERGRAADKAAACKAANYKGC
jgi:uncharacterized protein